MKKSNPIYSENSDISSLRYSTEYKEFINWFALPVSLRIPKTQKLFAKNFGLHQDTVSDWKKRPDFLKKVEKERQIWRREKTQDVVDVLYRKIIATGDAARIKLWLQFVEDWNEKGEKFPSPIDMGAVREEFR